MKNAVKFRNVSKYYKVIMTGREEDGFLQGLGYPTKIQINNYQTNKKLHIDVLMVY